ncbi:MAG: major facilitator transporter, partial [Devosia sp.]|nr:major facilitator transporter [Devosia sp.]
MKIEQQHRLYACFFLFAVALGALLSRMPDLQDALGVNKSELGLTLIGMAVGSLISLT